MWNPFIIHENFLHYYVWSKDISGSTQHNNTYLINLNDNTETI